MSRRYCLLAACILIALLALTWTEIAMTDGDETEEAVAFDKLPAAVQKAVKEAFPGATVMECVKETEDGKVEYEVELKSGKLEAEIELDASGKILATETEEEIPLDQLPKTVRSALEKLVKGGKLLEAERITENDSTTYEVEVQCGTVVLELGMNGSGKVLSIGVEDDEEEGEDEGEDDDDDANDDD
jgi:uncharacterized membrane protein YkoI